MSSKLLATLCSEASHASDFKLRLQTALRIGTRQDINNAPIITVIIVVDVHRALVTDLASGIRSKGTIAYSLSTLLASITAVGVAGAGASLAALIDAERPCWVLAR